VGLSHERDPGGAGQRDGRRTLRKLQLHGQATRVKNGGNRLELLPRDYELVLQTGHGQTMPKNWLRVGTSRA